MTVGEAQHASPSVLTDEQRAYVKFIAILLAFCTSAFILTIYVYERRNSADAMAALSAKLEKLTATYTLLYAEPLASGSAKRVNNYTIALMADPDVVAVTVQDAEGRSVDEFRADETRGRVFTREMTIHYAGESEFRTVGKLVLQVGTHRVDAALASRLVGDVILFVALVVAVLIGVAIAFKFSLKAAFKSLSYQATHDQLTDLLNRRAFVRVLANVIKQRRHRDKNAVLLFIDLDNFKTINDTKGHLAGDGALQFVTSIFRNTVRRMDIVSRMGGDEFCVLLPDCSDGRARQIAQEICAQIAGQTFVWAGDAFRLGVSIGIVNIDNSEATPADLIRLADQACYRAKQRGKNCIEFVDKRRRPLLRSV